MDIDSILKQYDRFGVCLGLERIEQLLADLGHPQQQVPIVHVAGTNGKGSVCAYLSAVLKAAGYRVGRFISPHLVNWNERICINDQPISDLDLERSLLKVQSVIQPDQPTQFELITAAAWWYFAEQRVEIAVIEVGLGGRLDATNVCDRPLVSVITSLSRDHWQRLGPTLADIAGEKAGILKPSRPSVVGPLPPAAVAVVKNRIAELDCPGIWVQPARLIQKGEQSWAEYQGIEYPLVLAGEFQLTNSAVAIAALLSLREQGWSKITDQAIVTGMGQTRWPGRMQWINWQGEQILIDGAHNPAAAKELRRYVDGLGYAQVNWVVGMLGTKDHQEILQALLSAHLSTIKAHYLYLVPIPGHASANPEALAILAQHVCPWLASCQTYPNLSAGLEAALQAQTSGAALDDFDARHLRPLNPPILGDFRSSSPVRLSAHVEAQSWGGRGATEGFKTPHLTVICGSLYLIGELLTQLQDDR
ncbi:MAG: bifunctional folylpolyglutamate synthase/dihydrofolate synthase [Aphanocapsa sp. GSE-SYN-MK-11-07L]|nr:bifunctional folylpolyglutamate synthase/dihydrofolate synthase [Aphanocapsa sp. GSE-SYN-MK-11-07L]